MPWEESVGVCLMDGSTALVIIQHSEKSDIFCFCLCFVTRQMNVISVCGQEGAILIFPFAPFSIERAPTPCPVGSGVALSEVVRCRLSQPVDEETDLELFLLEWS